MHRRWIIYGASVIVAGTVGGALLAPRPAGAVSKEIVELQRGLEQLLQNQQYMMTTITSDNAAKRTEIQLSLDSINKLSGAMSALEKSTQDIQSNSSARLDALSIKTESLSDNLQEAMARASKLSQQLADADASLRGVDTKLDDRPPTPAVTRHTMPRNPPQIRANQ